MSQRPRRSLDSLVTQVTLTMPEGAPLSSGRSPPWVQAHWQGTRLKLPPKWAREKPASELAIVTRNFKLPVPVRRGTCVLPLGCVDRVTMTVHWHNLADWAPSSRSLPAACKVHATVALADVISRVINRSWYVLLGLACS